MEEGAANRITDASAAIEGVENELANAVERQMMADVPLGAFLSGGIYSSLIVALMQSRSSRPVRSFTVGFDSAPHDESSFADAVARHLGTDHDCLFVTEAEAREVIPSLPNMYDEPFADSSQIPTHLVCRAARQTVTVALSGDGGDELFGGYNRHVHGPKLWWRLAGVPPFLRKGLAASLLAIPEAAIDQLGAAVNSIRPPGSRIAAVGQKVHRLAGRMVRAGSIDDLYRESIAIWPETSRLMTHPTVRAAETAPCMPLLDPIPAGLEEDPAGRMMLLDMRGYLPDDILCKVDRAAMATSLETRVPFLDPHVIAVSARLSPDLNIRGGEGKWILRQILYRYVPRNLVDRPKTGFSVPLAFWLRGPLRDWAEDLLSHRALEACGLFNLAPIREAWQDHLRGKVDRSEQLWVILMFQAWHASLRQPAQ